MRARLGDRLLDGVASYGKPMFNNERPPFETWIFDFDEDIYGETLEVALIGHVRGQEKFRGLDELIAAINATPPSPADSSQCALRYRSWTASSASSGSSDEPAGGSSPQAEGDAAAAGPPRRVRLGSGGRAAEPTNAINSFAPSRSLAKSPQLPRYMSDERYAPGGAETDYCATLFLPETEFPMRAGLPDREPDWLKRWEDMDIYGRQRAAGAGQAALHAA